MRHSRTPWLVIVTKTSRWHKNYVISRRDILVPLIKGSSHDVFEGAKDQMDVRSMGRNHLGTGGPEHSMPAAR